MHVNKPSRTKNSTAKRLASTLTLAEDDGKERLIHATFSLEPDTKATEGFGDDAQFVVGHILYCEASAHHGSHSDETAHFDHVRKDGVRSTTQGTDSFNGEPVRGDAVNLRSHGCQQAA